MSELLRFAATAFLAQDRGEQAIATPIHPINALLARSPDRAARNWYWRLTPAQRARCVRVMVESYGGESPYPGYDGPRRMYLVAEGWRDVTGRAPVLAAPDPAILAAPRRAITQSPRAVLAPASAADRAGAVSQDLERIFANQGGKSPPQGSRATARPARRPRGLGVVVAVIAQLWD